MASEQPYGEWLAANMKRMRGPTRRRSQRARLQGDELLDQQLAFGYTVEDLKYILGPMCENSEEAVGSMGTDTPLAVLSDKPQPLYNYFKQLFAQVTNPPLDAIREEIVTSVKTVIGPEGEPARPAAGELPRMIELKSPFIDNEQLARFKALNDTASCAACEHQRRSLPMLFRQPNGAAGASSRRWRSSASAADEAIAEGATTPHPLGPRRERGDGRRSRRCWRSAGLHNHLVREKKRTQIGLVARDGRRA